MNIQAIIRWRPGPTEEKIILLVSTVAVLLIGLAHLVSGEQFELHSFYFIPLGLTSWYLGQRAGITIACLSAADWLWMDYILDPDGALSWRPLLNEALRLGVLTIVALFIDRLKRSLERESDLARLDPLTQLNNRRSFDELSQLEIEHSRRYGHPLTAVMIDLDNFKEINDTLGHQTGDRLLTEVARLIRRNIRATDIASRLGGDEFALLLPQTDDKGALHLVSDLRDTLLEEMERNDWAVTFSIGIAVFTAPPPNVNALLHHADRLMYQAKKEGKNTIRQVSVNTNGQA